MRKWTKNLISGPILVRLAKIWAPKLCSWVLPLLDVRNCYKLLLLSYVISRKDYHLNTRKCWKTSFWALFRPVGPKFGSLYFFKKTLPHSVTGYHGQLSSCTISGKTNDPTWENLLTDRRTDRRKREISKDTVRLTSNLQWKFLKKIEYEKVTLKQKCLQSLT